MGPHTTLAAILHARGDLEGALRAYEAAVAIDPDQVGTYTSAGELVKEAGRFAEAARWYERALERNPRAGHARIMRSYALFRATGDAEHAQTIVEIARGPAQGVAWIEAIADEIAPGWRDA